MACILRARAGATKSTELELGAVWRKVNRLTDSAAHVLSSQKVRQILDLMRGFGRVAKAQTTDICGSLRGRGYRDDVSKPPIYINDVVLASHLVWMGYGHWFPNDVRGSGSSEIRKPDLRDLGPIHFGRKEDQPTRDDLREFFREGEPLLNHEVI